MKDSAVVNQRAPVKKHHYIGNILFGLCLVCMLSLVATFFLNGKDISKANIFGYRFTFVLSESMEPNIMTHALCLTHIYNFWEDVEDEVQVGDVVVYEASSGINIIHRVIEITDEGYITKGDNNDAADAEVVSPDQVVGEVAVIWNGFASVADVFT